ncbi:DUF1273 domain-containing protein [Mesobacillus maritimus]|uniref:DUF1273 domain-containing protein n=1 Tax=Mesobacillus maritimus TaxID=1643336 RepID=UPI00204232B2|nr:DUF1273 domain-containing protein [Mesobacillus maritimus]MCM3588771.1 DUF1273 domain-containing protein [Mesobacillus maritimus]MCM3669419.1 DUF1273 domain-containing protein [Mesobacillus maritimus]
MAKVAVVSGYKSYELGIFKQNDPAVKYIKMAILRELKSLVEEGLEWVLIGGQLGVELWAAEVVFQLQEVVPDLKLSVLTPFLNQEEKWSESNREWYESVVIQADHVDAITKRPYEKPWQLKVSNDFLIQKSDILILLYDDEKDGSPKYLLESAKKRQEKDGYDIRLINFSDLQLLIEEEQFKEQNF